MSMIDDIRKDREAGTPGPWVQSRVNPERIIGDKSCVADTHIRFSGLGVGQWEANTTRIARVPEMEAALIAADELASAAKDGYGDYDVSQEEYERFAAALAAFRAATGAT